MDETAIPAGSVLAWVARMVSRCDYDFSTPARWGDVELLSIAIGGARRQAEHRSVAVELLSRFRTLEGIARASPVELRQVTGMGPVRSECLHAALHLGRRSMRAVANPPEIVGSPASAARLLGPALRGLPCEELHALYLDRRRAPLGQRRLTVGSDAFTVVDPRQIYRPAIASGASAVVIAHNHPSGDPSPSPQDREVTRRVAAAGRVLGVPLLDHLVFGADRWTSLAEEGGCGL